jgi:hypothetical protein
MVYYFDHYEYKTARKDQTKTESQMEISPSEVLAPPAEETLIASADESVVTPEPTKAKVALAKEEAIAKINNMSKEERKEFKRELKKDMKELKKLKKDPSTSSTKAMGHDMRYAAIFGSIGIVLLIIGGDVLTILGAVALIIGLYFFIRWLSTQ